MATKASVKLEGLDDLRRTLRTKAPREARNILRNTVNGIAARVRDELKRNIKKDTRAAEKSIKVVRRRGEPDYPVSDVRGGTTAPYILMLEFGTSRTKAQPFITPTVESMRPEVPKIMREEFIEKLVKSIAKQAKKQAME